MDERAAVQRALEPTARPSDAASAARDLVALTERGLGGDRAAYEGYQAILYELHEGEDPRTDAVRRWLASTTYAVEERFIPEEKEPGSMPSNDFLDRVEREITTRSRLGGPLSEHLFEGQPTLEDVKIYMRHHWYRSRRFYRLFAELALRLRLEDVGVLYQNLGEETGGQPGGTAHPLLLQRLVEYLGLPSSFDSSPSLPEAHAYLNNRTRCVRHPDAAWGIALLYSLELVTAETHGHIYRMLRRLGVPEPMCEFHRIHMSGDLVHANDLRSLTVRLLGSAESQRTFLRSIAHHQRLSRTYFARIWDEMQANRSASHPRGEG